MKRYMAHILVSAEKITEHFLKVQVHDEGTLADGGMEGLVVDVKPTVFALRAAMSVYLYPQSRFYKDETLRTAMEQAIDFVARTKMRTEALTIQCAISIPHQTQHFAIIQWIRHIVL